AAISLLGIDRSLLGSCLARGENGDKRKQQLPSAWTHANPPSRVENELLNNKCGRRKQPGYGRSGLDLHEIGWRLRIRGIRMPARRPNGAGAQAVHQRADRDRTSDKMIDLHWTGQLDGSDPVQCAADGTTALRAVRRATENTRLDTTLQVGRIVGRHLGEETIIRVARRMKDSASHAIGNQELRILLMQRRQDSRESLAIIRGQHLRTLFTELRSVNTDPNAVDLRACVPERDILLEVVVASEHGTCDDPMDIDLAAFDV